MENWEHLFRQYALEPALIEAIKTDAVIMDVPQGKVVLRAGDFVSGVPLVIKGVLKVERIEETRELLLYYIQPGEDSPSQVIAEAVQDSSILFLPKARILEWNKMYPSLQGYFLQLFQSRYQGLIHTIDQLAFQKLDKRLLDHLLQKADTLATTELHLTHQAIADEMGTSREVISRALKKLEKEGKLVLGRNNISLL